METGIFELDEFIRKIKYENRNPKDDQVLKYLDDEGTNPTIELNNGEKLYRARIKLTNDIPEKSNEEGEFWGFNKKDSWIPPVELTQDMRGNYRYIPYLYCSNNPYVAAVEVRPRVVSQVSIATIVVKKKLRILDFTLNSLERKSNTKKEKVYLELSKLFSKPIVNDDDILDYVPTQYIAEYVKNLDYHGLAYSSSLLNYENYKDKYNLLIFNYDRCDIVKSNLYKVDNIIIEYEPIDKDEERCKLVSYEDENLSNI